MKHAIAITLVLDGAEEAASVSTASELSTGAKLGRGLRRMTTAPFLGLIRVYQVALSPCIPAIFGPTCSCRYYPSCSHYAVEALQQHGVLLGLLLAMRRLLRCTPFHRGGIDPVPAPGLMGRLCQKVRPRSLSA